MIASLEWCAGFIDADGHIAAQRYVTGPKAPSIQGIRLIATSVIAGPLHAIRDRFGGSVHQRRGESRGYVWQVSGAKAAAALEQLAPHLIVRRKQAAVALALLATDDETERWRLSDLLIEEHHSYKTAQ